MRPRPHAQLVALAQLAAVLSVAFGSIACGGAPETAPAAPASPRETLADSIADAHGFGRWREVARLDFAFAVDVADTNRVRREWSWFPGADSVVAVGPGGTVAYVRNTPLDSLAEATDADFVNDTYWLLMPFYLVWSEGGYESSVTYRDTMPLSREIGTRLTVQYRPEGGYTPGDAYDLYVDADHVLREWVFRKGGAAEPSMVTDWSDYRTYGGLLLPGDHRGEGPLRIYHPDIGVAAVE